MKEETSYSVEDLALKAEISVDTIRYYQGLGLISPPQKMDVELFTVKSMLFA